MGLRPSPGPCNNDLVRILGIETSCDDTAIAVVEDRTKVLSSIVSSQTDLHRAYGGIVPELASRHHLQNIEPILREALAAAGMTLSDLTGVSGTSTTYHPSILSTSSYTAGSTDHASPPVSSGPHGPVALSGSAEDAGRPGIDAIAVTAGPGLIGSLLVGVSFAKALAWATKRPLVAVNHLEGHVRAAFLENPDTPYPALALIVSGGHTSLYVCPEEGVYRMVARTRDDASGEAFDKAARLLGLGYPGGPIIDRLAKHGDPAAVAFPRARMSDGSLDFSFSGLKTALLRHAKATGLAVERTAPSTPYDPHGPERRPVPDANVDFPAAESDLAERSPAAAGVDAGRTPAGRDRAATREGDETMSGARAPAPERPPAGHDSAACGESAGTSPAVGVAPRQEICDIAASFQRAVVDVLIDRTLAAAAAEGVRSVIVSGGVACNSLLRAEMRAACEARGLVVAIPSPRYCTDNAAMIAAAGFLHFERGETAGFDLTATPGWRLGGPEAARTTLRHK